MFCRILSIALTLVVLTACERQEPDGASGAGDRTRTQQTPPPGPPGSEAPAEGGQHYDAGAARVEMHEQTGGMSEEERAAALRACERLEAAERERCEAEVRERSNPESSRLERQE